MTSMAHTFDILTLQSYRIWTSIKRLSCRSLDYSTALSAQKPRGNTNDCREPVAQDETPDQDAST